jgi:hypothetical protein
VIVRILLIESSEVGDIDVIAGVISGVYLNVMALFG